jgi:hypothetical protein
LIFAVFLFKHTVKADQLDPLIIEKSKMKRKRQTSSPRWNSTHDEFKTRVVADSLKNVLPDVSADDHDWLLSTREVYSFVLHLDDNEMLVKKLLETLKTFYVAAKERHADLLACVKRRMIELEIQKQQETWTKMNVVISVTPNQLLPPNFGLVLVPSTSPAPDGLVVIGYAKDPFGQSGPGEKSGVLRMGDIVTAFRPGTGSGRGAVRAALNMFVNLSVLRTMQALAPGGCSGSGSGGSSGSGGTALTSLPTPSSVTLTLMRLDDASAQARETAKSRALSPERVSFVSSSTLLTSYARATHPKRGEETLWLLNRDSVANILVAPLERREELAVLFAKKKVALTGAQGVLTPSWTASLVKMYELFTVAELVQKYIDHGEVGRGRNKTSLKTSKQVVNVVVTALKKGGLLS